MMKPKTPMVATQILLLVLITQIKANDNGYLRYVKDGCFLRHEALSCLKYRALKITIDSIFGQSTNETKVNNVISIVPLDQTTIDALDIKAEDVGGTEPKSLVSEWAELTKYLMKFVKDFFKLKGVKFNLPDGARTMEDESADARGKKRKQLAIIIPFLTLLSTLKTKMILVPILLGVMLIKKLLIAAAFLLPGLLNTLKHCKHHAPHYSYYGSESDFNSDYANSYYSSGAGYSKDWASNRAYGGPKHRPSPTPVYITAPGNSA